MKVLRKVSLGESLNCECCGAATELAELLVVQTEPGSPKAVDDPWHGEEWWCRSCVTTEHVECDL